jgi:hypothetical protein
MIPVWIRTLGICLPLIAASTGCSTTLLNDPGRLIGFPRTEKHVTRILCLWEPGEGIGTDGKPARGFSGQILFFGPHGDAGARVRGTVQILQFDEFDPNADEPEPLHTFRFEPDAWDVHRTEGSLGHSYSVFVPYMQPHKQATNCGLKVEFVAKDGRITQSETTQIMLPARNSLSSNGAVQRNIVRRTSGPAAEIYADRTEAKPSAPQTESRTEPPSDSLETTTIRLPKSAGKSTPRNK